MRTSWIGLPWNPLQEVFAARTGVIAEFLLQMIRGSVWPKSHHYVKSRDVRVVKSNNSRMIQKSPINEAVIQVVAHLIQDRIVAQALSPSRKEPVVVDPQIGIGLGQARKISLVMVNVDLAIALQLPQ